MKNRMSRPVVTIEPNCDYQIANKLMQEYGVRHLPVVNDGGELVGIVAKRDLLLTAARQPDRPVQVSDVMQRDVVTTTIDTSIEKAAWLMLRRKVGALPIVGNDNRLVGIITETDIYRAFIEEQSTFGV